MTKRIIIYQRIVPHYRIPFFEKLYEYLLTEGVELVVIFGNENPILGKSNCTIDRPWAVQKQIKYFNVFGKELVVQLGSWSSFKFGDYIIVEQANRLLLNYIFYFLRAIKVIKLGFWGHGRNFQTNNSSGLAEKLKKIVSTKADWWFGYTEQSCQIITELGFDKHKITNVMNSIDTSELIDASEQVTNNDIGKLKTRMGITSDNVAIYCGGLYKEKRIEFLLEACIKIKLKIPDFQLIVIGDGPDLHLIDSFSVENSWVCSLGPLTGTERVPYFMLSKVALMPGLVGLAILDSFALGVPMVTTDIPIHSPEFKYLEPGVNGMVTGNSLEYFSAAVVDLLSDETKRQVLVNGCQLSKKVYTIEGMAKHFGDGILKFLDT